MALLSRLLHLAQSCEGLIALESSSEGPPVSLLEPAPQEEGIANNPRALFPLESLAVLSRLEKSEEAKLWAS